MKVLLCNIPFVKFDAQGGVHTGPNAGSRWPFTLPGMMTAYAPYPFLMGYATTYLQAHGIEAVFYDAMAQWHYDKSQWRGRISQEPGAIAFEISTPVVETVLEEAEFWKASGRKIILMGPHCAAYAEKLLALPFVDHVIKGEYEIPLQLIADGSTQRLFEYQHVKDIDLLDGDNWTPYRPLNYLENYYDPSMATPKTQLTVNTSRGCAFKCTYCQWPRVMANKTYRARRPDLVIDEIFRVKAIHPVRSIFFDDDTWNLGGPNRIGALCKGLKEIGLPWTMMGRLDVHEFNLFDLMVESGLVGFRFGIETFAQHVLNATDGKRSGVRQFEAAKHILSRYKGIEVHFTSMRDMPGQSEADWEADQLAFAELKTIAEQHGNRMHWQVSRTAPFPGTVLWEQLRAAGHGKLMERSEFDGAAGETELNRVIRGFVPLTVGKR